MSVFFINFLPRFTWHIKHHQLRVLTFGSKLSNNLKFCTFIIHNCFFAYVLKIYLKCLVKKNVYQRNPLLWMCRPDWILPSLNPVPLPEPLHRGPGQPGKWSITECCSLLKIWGLLDICWHLSDVSSSCCPQLLFINLLSFFLFLKFSSDHAWFTVKSFTVFHLFLHLHP